ncbi:MAG: hypothetical protein Q9172_000366 [Xanthocarpia lactea]
MHIGLVSHCDSARLVQKASGQTLTEKGPEAGDRAEEKEGKGGPNTGGLRVVMAEASSSPSKAGASGADDAPRPSTSIVNPVHGANEGREANRKCLITDEPETVDHNKKKYSEEMARRQNTNGQHSPSHCDNVVYPIDGLSIKGAAARRQQAIELTPSNEEDIKVDGKTDTADLRIEDTDPPVLEDREGRRYEKARSRDPRIDSLSIKNTKAVTAEMASVTEQFTTILNQHPISFTGWIMNHSALVVGGHSSEVGEQRQSHSSRAPSNSMPRLQSFEEQSRTNKKGKLPITYSVRLFAASSLIGIMKHRPKRNTFGSSTQRKDISNGPQIPSWLAEIQASNPAKPLASPGIHIPNNIQSSRLAAHHRVKETGIIRWPVGAADADNSHPARRTISWVPRSEWPLPGELANPSAYHDLEHVIDLDKNKPSAEMNNSKAHSSLLIAGKHKMALRNQSPNIPSLRSPTNYRNPEGHPTTSKERPLWIAPHLRFPERDDAAEPHRQNTWLAPHLSVSGQRRKDTQSSATLHRQQPPAEARAAESGRQLEVVVGHLGIPVTDAEFGQWNPIPVHEGEEFRGYTQPTDTNNDQLHDQTQPQFSSSVLSGHLLMTNSSDFLSRAAVTLNGLKQISSDQARSPESTGLADDAVSKAMSPPRQNTVQQQPQPDGSGVRGRDGIHDNPASTRDSAEDNVSDESVRGLEDENHLSSIPESMFFAHAYNGRDASKSPEVVFEGRKPRNPYKGLRDAMTPVPGWEGVEVPAYEPGQLMGWDGKWQEAPVEWDRRDLYDYTAAEHQQNMKNFIDDRFEQFKKGLCPSIDVEHDVHFRSGRALSAGFVYFAKPIDEKEHHHVPPDDPFSQGKLTKTANMAIENYLRVHSKRLKEQENREHTGADRKKAAKAQRAAEQQAREQALAEAAALRPPNVYKPKVNIYIRPAEAKDLAQICDIHNYYIRTSAVTGERVELNEYDWRTRFDNCEEEHFPFLVAILPCYGRMDRQQGRKEKVVGFTYAEDFVSEQTVWGHTCELQLFVHQRYLRKGIGKNLMDCILRGIDPNYQAKRAVQFDFAPSHSDRYEGGGERVISNVIFALPYTAEEDQHAQWVGQWLFQEFKFELQGLLIGIGRVQKGDSRINLAYYVMETLASV